MPTFGCFFTIECMQQHNQWGLDWVWMMFARVRMVFFLLVIFLRCTLEAFGGWEAARRAFKGDLPKPQVPVSRGF